MYSKSKRTMHCDFSTAAPEPRRMVTLTVILSTDEKIADNAVREVLEESGRDLARGSSS